jgi:hypothetical protein
MTGRILLGLLTACSIGAQAMGPLHFEVASVKPLQGRGRREERERQGHNHGKPVSRKIGPELSACDESHPDGIR